MEAFEFKDDIPNSARKTSAFVWNILTGIALVGVLVVILLFSQIYSNPYSSFNPFPPPTLPAALAFPTITPTFGYQLPPTWTPGPTHTPTTTSTPKPSATPTAPAASPAGEQGLSQGMPFVVQEGQPLAVANIAYPELDCEWMGVAGQVIDRNGAAVRGQQIELGGTLEEVKSSPETLLTLTGLAPQYGPGYYEISLADRPAASKGALWVQLLDQAGLPMSEKVYFDTYEDCDQNLIIINFVQVD